ncbi:MAG: hypothetical protein K2H43_03490, partial [Clostridia bacterium]|nr:hypothetical protein [Clostridia bacterium]
TKLVDMVRSCVQHVLGYENIKFEVSFASFREKLKTEIIGTEHPMYEQLLESPYFYKKTITKTLINLAKTLQDGAERENVFVNIGNVISGIWENLSSDDRWSVGRAYAQANNDGDVNFSKAVKSLLIKVKGFDYVPENLRSNSYIVAAKDLLSAHYGANNFYREPSYAKTLCEMGTSIPMPAFGNCMTAILACKLGNTYGISWDAQEYLDKLLDRVSPDRWRYYLANIFPTDEVVLYKLYVQSNALSRFIDVAVKYKLKDISFTNSGIGKLIQDLSNGNLTAAKNKCRDLYRKLEQV